MARKPTDVERLARWAFRDELPKTAVALSPSAWNSIASIGMLGSRIDDQIGPMLPAALGGPHPDAKVIERHVRNLADTEIDWDRSRDALLGPLVGILVGDARYGASIPHPIRTSVLVGTHAKMGTRPNYEPEPPIPMPVTGRKTGGHPAVYYLDDDGREVEGRTKGRHYGRLARSHIDWQPDAGYIAFRRAEYCAWRAGLVELAESLAGQLTDFDPLPPTAPVDPWKYPPPAPRKIWHGTSANAGLSLSGERPTRSPSRRRA